MQEHQQAAASAKELGGKGHVLLAMSGKGTVQAICSLLFLKYYYSGL